MWNLKPQRGQNLNIICDDKNIENEAENVYTNTELVQQEHSFDKMYTNLLKHAMMQLRN